MMSSSPSTGSQHCIPLLFLALHLGCAAAPPPAPEAQAATSDPNLPARGLALTGTPADIIERHGTGLPAYDLTDAVWLEGLPVAVNSDFDMAVAMMMDDVGPGLAAAQRKKRNAEMAGQLASLALTSEAQAYVAALREQGVHRFALFFGMPDALQLRVVNDRFDEQGLLTEHALSRRETLPAATWTTRALSAALLSE